MQMCEKHLRKKSRAKGTYERNIMRKAPMKKILCEMHLGKKSRARSTYERNLTPKVQQKKSIEKNAYQEIYCQ